MDLSFLSALAAGPQRRAGRFIARAALALAGAACALVGLGFASGALFLSWRAQYGAVHAAVGLAVIYVAAAGLIFLWRSVAGASGTPPRAAIAGAVPPSDPRLAALSLGADFARQLTPLQIVLLGAVSGFVAGRRL